MGSIDRKFRILAVANRSRRVYTEDEAALFLAKDKAFLLTLPDYYRHCQELGAGEDQLRAVELMTERVRRYQESVESKVPDVDPVLEKSALEE